MARPRTAKLQTAYDLGHEHGRTGSRPHAADDVIGDDPDMQQAYDDGLTDGTDSLDTGREPPPAAPKAPRPRAHRPNPSSRQRAQGAPAARAAAGTPKAGAKPNAGGSSPRFSHPLHWGSGARGHVVGAPTLRPPRSLSASDGTGFLFGLFLYAMTLNYIRYGQQGMTSWLSAKFINKPTITAAQTKAAG